MESHMDFILLSLNVLLGEWRSWINFKLSCRDVLPVCLWQMWKGDEMGKGESNIPSLQVCEGERALQRSHIWQSFVNSWKENGRKHSGSCGRWKDKKHVSHMHSAGTMTTTFVVSHPVPPSFFNLMIFRYTLLHGQNHAVTWLFKAAVYVHFSNKPQGWC